MGPEKAFRQRRLNIFQVWIKKDLILVTVTINRDTYISFKTTVAKLKRQNMCSCQVHFCKSLQFLERASLVPSDMKKLCTKYFTGPGTERLKKSSRLQTIYKASDNETIVHYQLIKLN